MNSRWIALSVALIVVGGFGCDSNDRAGPDPDPDPAMNVSEPDVGDSESDDVSVDEDVMDEIDTGGGEEPVAAEIQFPADEFVLEAADPQRPSAEVLDDTGQVMDGAFIAWASEDPSIVEITSGGFALGHETGETALIASHGDLKATWPTRVVGTAVAAITVAPADATVIVGWELPYLITLFDANNVRIDEERPVDWSTTDEDIATIDGDGIAHAQGPGEVEIVATVEGVEDRATLSVTDVEVESIGISPSSPSPIERGDEIQFEAQAFDLDGDSIDSPVVEWSSSDTDVLTVDEFGLADGVGVGEATVTATLGELEASADVTVYFSIQRVAAGDGFGCAIAAQRLYCWGDNDLGQLGDGSTSASDEPVAAAFDEAIETLSLGASHGCLVDGDGEIWCWGNNDSGQVGQPAGGTVTSPTALGAGLEFRDVSAGLSHSCGVTTSDAIYCWGRNDDHQLGNTGSSTDEPTAVSSSMSFQSVVAGGAHTCAIGTSDSAYCWGKNDRGQLGGGTDADKSAHPTEVIGGYNFNTISGGLDFTCGTASSGPPACWGANDRGQLGNGGTVDQDVPLTLELQPGESLSTITTGDEHACGLAPGGSPRCWGAADGGRLGSDSSDDAATPQTTDHDESFSALDAGGRLNCGRTSDHRVFCWGGAPADGASLVEIDL